MNRNKEPITSPKKYPLLLAPSGTHMDHIPHFVQQLNKVMPEEALVLGFFSLKDRDKAESLASYLESIRFMSEEDEQEIKRSYVVEGRVDIDPFAAYAQLFAPSYYRDIGRFLYVEVDQVIRKPLADLFEQMERQKSSLGAVPISSRNGEKDSVPSSFKAVMGKSTYFNTGVLYVDTEKWHEKSYFKKCWNEVLQQYREEGERLDFYAQGAINNALAKDIDHLSSWYNVQDLGGNVGISGHELNRGAILHWNGRRKPWLKEGLYKEYYYGSPRLYAIMQKFRRKAEGFVQRSRKKVKRLFRQDS